MPYTQHVKRYLKSENVSSSRELISVLWTKSNFEILLKILGFNHLFIKFYFSTTCLSCENDAIFFNQHPTYMTPGCVHDQYTVIGYVQI